MQAGTLPPVTDLTSPTDGPPVAAQRPHEHTTHGVVRADPYAWMSVESEELTAHLAAERAFYDLSTAHLGSLVSRLRSEMEARVPDRTRSGTWSRPRFSYYTEDERNRDYAVIWRESRNDFTPDATKSSADGPNDDDFARELVLDVNTLDEGTGYLDLGYSVVSPDENLLAYAVDATGDEVFRLRFRDLRTGEDLPDVVEDVHYSGAWTSDSSAFVYAVPDDAWRPVELRLHRLGTDQADDVSLLTETDRKFELSVRLSRSEQAILVLSQCRDTSECWWLDPSGADLVPRSIGGRRRGVEYRAEHAAGHGPDGLLLVTNDGAEEFRLVGAPVPPVGGQSHDAWFELRPEDPDERLERVDAFATHVVASVRRDGSHQLRILAAGDLAGPGRLIGSRFPTGGLQLARNTLHAADSVAVTDEAWTEPPVHATVSFADGTVTDHGRHEAPTHDPASYVSELRRFPTPDGHGVSATVVRHRDTALDGTAPVLLYGYGSYEAVFEPEWEEPLTSLLDRGVVWVHTHLRGGGEGGRRSWLDGRMHAKQNTFTDHIAVADGLAAEGLVDPSRIATRGLSAGGLLQGAVFNQRPDRWRAVVAEVPFVDVITTMLDDSIPLTVNEWDEWGDPSVRADFDAMLAYSPYDNPPPAGGRPDLLVTGAVHDTRVLVREPAKWVARLRETDPDWSPHLLFRVETGTGSHVGPSGRLGHLAYEAEVTAWLLDRLGVPTTGG
jgi:oligopeptidase B